MALALEDILANKQGNLWEGQRGKMIFFLLSVYYTCLCVNVFLVTFATICNNGFLLGTLVPNYRALYH